jgi:hypothetical protein
VREHAALQRAIGCAPSVYACYRFTVKLRTYSDKLDACITRVLASLRAEHPDMGSDMAIDASDLPAFANGQRYVSKGGRARERFSDPDASWGHRSAVSTRKGGGFYGYKIHMATCTRTRLPLAWQVETAASHEAKYVASLLDAARERGFAAETCAMDKGYDVTIAHEACMERNCSPVTPLRETPTVKRGGHRPPTCEHGEGASRATIRVRLPSGAARLASASPRVDGSRPTACIRSSHVRRSAGASPTRAARPSNAFGRLKNEWAMLPLRVRGLQRVRLHADLTVLAKLPCALARARAVRLAV